MTESSKGNRRPATLTSGTTEKNRLMSWDNTPQVFTRPVAKTPISKGTIILRLLGLVGRVIRLTPETLLKLPLTLFKLGYEIAKLVAKGLSIIRRVLSLVK